MPHVIVKMYSGRSEHQKTQLAEAIVKDVMAFAKVGDDAVSLAIEEAAPGHLEQPRKIVQKTRIQSA
jgi:4-oxalocrotonate tautomerase